MTMPLWAVEAAAAFWEDAGGEEPFPRNLRRPIANALPLTVVFLPALTVANIASWLMQRGVPYHARVRDRALRACLVARYGQGIVFIEGSDPDSEQRFSLGHELSHFLKDYWWPRCSAAQGLGQQVLEVLDGERPPRKDERIHSLLAHTRIGFFMHMMDRTTGGAAASAAVDIAERDADLLALELLAPSSLVLQKMSSNSRNSRDAIRDLLITEFGLPDSAAMRYADLLAPAPVVSDSFVRRLGLLP